MNETTVALVSIVSGATVAVASSLSAVWVAYVDRRHQRRLAAEERMWEAKEQALRALSRWIVELRALVDGRVQAKDAVDRMRTWSGELNGDLGAVVEMYASQEVRERFARLRGLVFDRVALLDEGAWAELARLRRHYDVAASSDYTERAIQLEVEMTSILEDVGVMGDGGGPMYRMYEELDGLGDAVRKDRGF